jgi:hypothetical protein
MFHETSARLITWIDGVAGEPVASLGHGTTPGTRRVALSLLDVRPLETRPGAKIEVTVRYLLTVAAETPTEAHRLLGELTFAAMTHREFQVERAPVPLELWIALGLPPQPALTIGATVSRDRRDIEGRSGPRLLAPTPESYLEPARFERRSSAASGLDPNHRRRASDLRRVSGARALVRS